MPKETEPGAFSLTPEYANARKNFRLAIYNDNSYDVDSLEELNILAEKIQNKNDSIDFEKFLLGVKAQNPGLYNAFKKDLNIENNPEHLAA